MKKIFLLPLLLVLFVLPVIAQKPNLPAADSKEYNQLKKEGKLSGPQVQNSATFKSLIKDYPAADRSLRTGTDCGCYVTPDASYTLAMAPNDDGSSGLIPIPFNFCLYGTNYTSLFINNNGNVSFGSPYSTFSSFPFPDPSYVMVAPFWGDVDTRGAGTVKYKITPTALYVNWDAVGYYSYETDLLNTFQLIITDGTDPVLPTGNNIAFCYKDMQWTTGAASSGVGGFGGVPSTVGVNKGDGVNYIQIGRFDQPGAAYDGGYGANDGVSWLDNQSFYFNSCSSTNIAPIISGLSNCDTINVCATGDTLILNGLFLSPELGQTTTISINLGGTPDATVISNIPGNSAIGQVMLIASPANAGNNTITFTATDDGSPVGTSVILVNVFVDTTGLYAFNPIISGSTTFCEGGSTTLSVSPTTYDSYLWSNGSTTTSATIDTSGLVFVTSKFNNCTKTNSVYITEYPAPSPEILGDNFNCGTTVNPVYLDSVSNYTSFIWSDGSTNDTLDALSGTFTVTVTDSNGCTATTPPFTLTTATPAVSITGDLEICAGENSLLVANATIPSGASYLWSTGETISSVTINTEQSYTVLISYSNGCTAFDSVYVEVNPLPVVQILGNNFNCGTNPSPLYLGSSDGFSSSTWSNGNTNDTIWAISGTFTITATDTNGCTVTSAPFTLNNSNPLVAITGVQMFCPGDSISLFADATIPSGASYLWSTGATTSSITVYNEQSYTVLLSYSNGCTAKDSVFVDLYPKPAANFSKSPTGTTKPGEYVYFTDLSTGSVITWNWFFGDGPASTSLIQNPNHIYNDIGSYEITLAVQNTYGCWDTIRHWHDILIEVLAPNVFTPNNDGTNDYLEFKNLQYFPSSHLTIYNRWGNKIYDNDDYQNDWNAGSHKDGVYYFILEGANLRETIHGYVQVLR